MSSRSLARRPALKARIREAATTAILEAAEEVAAERGLDATSTAAIAERAEVAVGTLYNYFPDRDALLSALFKLRRDELLPHVVAAAAATRDLPFEGRLRGYLADVMHVFENYRRFCRVAMSVDQGSVKIKNRQSIVLDTITAELRVILKPVVGAAAAEEQAKMIFGALKAIMPGRIERDESLEAAAHQVADLFLSGIKRK